MNVCVLLLYVSCVCWTGGSQQATTYLVSTPIALHIDAEETVLVQMFGLTREVKVYVFIKTSMAPDHQILSHQMMSLNHENHHQAIVSVRIFSDQLDSTVDHVILHVQSVTINQHLLLPVSRQNGFLFIQTDKPLYTPLQNGACIFAQPGASSSQSQCLLHLQVLPSFSILVQPGVNYISLRNFRDFCFKVKASYLHGAPVSFAEVFLRFGYVSQNVPPIIIPNSVTRERLSSSGEVDVCVNIEEVLSRHDGPKDLNGLIGKYLYIAVLLEEESGGISQEADFSAVKFIKSPYSLTLVSTPLFIKPGLPYNVQVVVKDHLLQGVNQVPVQMTEQHVYSASGKLDIKPCPEHAVTKSEGLVIFACNTPATAVKALLTIETADSSLPAESQARLALTAVAYHSPNRYYIYIDLPMSHQPLNVGHFAHIKVYSLTPGFVPIDALSFMVLSKGKVVHFGSRKFVASNDTKQTLSFQVTETMVPSVRLLVYYILYGKGTAELVADSVWLKVNGVCINGLQTELSYKKHEYRPKKNLKLDIRTKQEGLVALAAVDSAVYQMYPNYKDPVAMVLHHIEQSDQGCGGDGGKDAADVFRLAGLSFITNANAQPAPSDAPCTAVLRGKRALTEQIKTEKAASFGLLKPCCEHGMKYIPKSVTCRNFARQTIRRPPHHEQCRRVFTKCCEFIQLHMDQDQNLILGHHDMGANFDAAPSRVRSFFPESWLWEIQPTRGDQMSVTRTLPDSLTTWEIKAIGMFRNGICVSEAVHVSVQLPLSMDVQLPYQVIRGEQLELSSSVYNQQREDITYCVMLTVGPQVCLLQSKPDAAGAGLFSTVCQWNLLPARGVAKVAFTLMGLETGEHTLTFTLKTQTHGIQDIMEKKLRVEPEGVKIEDYFGGILDPQGVYGFEKLSVMLKNLPPANLVPNTATDIMVTINGEILGDILAVVLEPQGLRQLIKLPGGSLESELNRVLPLALVYQYLEATQTWNALGIDIQKNSAHIRHKIKEGLVSISSFRRGDSSYSMWTKREASTWLTAATVQTLASVDKVIQVDRQTLSESVSWLIRNAQNGDGSFSDMSSFKANKIMAEGEEPVQRSVYLTSFVLIALCRATSIRERILQLKFQEESMKAAANFISKHVLTIKSMYLRALATYALMLHDPINPTCVSLINDLEIVARQKGHPAMLRYWQESGTANDWLRPDQSSGLTMETTAYMLLTMLLKGRISYAKPIVSWLTQDQHYGQGLFSMPDTILTLEALTEYSRVVPRAVLDQDITVRYRHKGMLTRVHLSLGQPVAMPIQVLETGDITVSTGFGRGVSSVKMRRIYYQTMASSHNCNFELIFEMVGVDAEASTSIHEPYLSTCAKYKPPPNEVAMESTMTVMKIQLPTGIEARLEDLSQFQGAMEPIISHYELQGNTVLIQMDSVPSEMFFCVAFRIRVSFKVGGAISYLLTVFEPQDKGSFCIKSFSSKEQKLERLCVADQCQCMTVVCATYRANYDLNLTPAKRRHETCQLHIKHAYKLHIKSSQIEGDFLTFTATVREVLKNANKAFQSLGPGSEVDLIKKVTCNLVDVEIDQQYLFIGSSGSEVQAGHISRFRLLLDADAILEPWPIQSGDPISAAQSATMDEYALDLQLFSCPNA
ncbi:complement C5 isoform X3 [Stigmatopora argus]